MFLLVAYTRELELRGKGTFPNWMLTLAHFVILSMCAFVIIGLICCVARICFFIGFIANKKNIEIIINIHHCFQNVIEHAKHKSTQF